MKLSGQCHCGEVAYEIDEDYLEGARADCDCRDCQRATGALAIPFFSAGSKNWRLTRGAPSEFKGKNGIKCDLNGKWMFCANCGTKIMWIADNGNFVTALVGTINELDEVLKLPIRQ